MVAETFYNEYEPYAAQWLRNLETANLISKGVIDERSIKEIEPREVVWYGRAHFFAGIGGWELALQLAGWPEDREVWTGSCPCQPFSQAGKRKGVEDERHLWPVWYELIKKCHPATIFGEQVASKDGRLWLSGVRSDLEALGYAVGGADLCAAGVSAPHLRQRLWWVAHAKHDGFSGQETVTPSSLEDGEDCGVSIGSSTAGRMGNTCQQSSERKPGEFSKKEREGDCKREQDGSSTDGYSDASKNNGWGEFDIAWCNDPRDNTRIVARRIEPGTFPLADGVPARVGKIRAYGNAIVPQVAAEFIKAFMECVF